MLLPPNRPVYVTEIASLLPDKYLSQVHIGNDFVSECLFSLTFATIKYNSCRIILSSITH